MSKLRLPPAMRSETGWPLFKRNSMALIFAVLWCLLPSNSSSAPQKHSGEVPTASIDCKQDSDTKSKYLCVVVAQCPEDTCPQYKWTVPGGKIIGDATIPNITIDTRQVEGNSVVVTCRVKWKLPAEEVTLRKRIDLR